MKIRALTVLGLLGVCGIAHAGNVQFYGGDADGRSGLADENGGIVNDAWVFDDFNWGGGTVEALFGNYYTDTGAINGMEFEIRSSVSAGNGGTLVAFGSTSAFTWLDTGFDAFGLDLYRGDADVADFGLAAGTYHMAVRPVFTAQARAFLATTGGANSVGSPIGNGNSFFNSTFFAQNFADVSVVLTGAPGEIYDFSQGVIGDRGHVVPLPTTAGLGAAGLALVGLRRRRA